MSKSNLLDRLRLFDRRRRLYRRVYDSPDGKAFIKDLAAFCAFEQDAVIASLPGGAGPGPQAGPGIDPYALAVAAGRRSVMLRIAKYLGISDFAMQLRLKEAEQGEEHASW